MTNYLKLLPLLITLVLLQSCGSDPEVNITGLTATIAENPNNGDVLGTVSATTTDGTIAFSLAGEMPVGAMAISQEGIVTVADASLFDFEVNPTISATAIAEVEGITDQGIITITLTDVDENTSEPLTIWTGPTFTFSKETADDHTLEENQDRITDNVWITRKNKGQIFNIKVEDEADKDDSPVGVEFALGTTADIATATFAPFRATVGNPQGAVGVDLIMHLIEDDIYLDFKITEWGQGSNNDGGNVSYERSTPN